MAASISIRHDQVRADIVKVARVLLAEKGHEKVSLREISKQAGYSPASLYEYFSSRDEILRAVQDDVEKRMFDAVFAAERSEPPGRRRIVAILLAYIDFARTHPQDFLLLYVKTLSRSRSIDSEEHAPFLVLTRAVESAIAEGEIAVRDGMPVAGVAYGLWAAAHGMATLQITFLSEFPVDVRQADRWMLVDFVRGLVRRDAHTVEERPHGDR